MPRADRVLLAGLLAGILMLSGAAWAQGMPGLQRKVAEGRDQPVTITADVLEYESRREVYSAKGHVVIVQGDRTLKADWVAFNAKTGAGVASGNVEITEGTDTLKADFVEFNIDNLEGVVREGSLDSPQSRFRTWGSEIQKTGENTYTFKNGVFTTCRCPEKDDTEPWRLRAQEAEVEINGYGTLHDATIEVLGVPVFWLPWMIYPIKTERQTGLLFPEVAIASRDGFGLGLPFFWAVHDQVNLTLTPEWTSRRGFKGASDLEYVVGQKSGGEAVFAYGYDEKIDPNSLKEPFDRNRWLTGGEHDLALPGGVRFDTDYAFASDNQVPLDYDDLSRARADRYLESRAALDRGFGGAGRFGGVASAWYADDLQNPDDIDRDKVMLQRLPHVQLEGLVGGIPGVPLLKPSLDAEYTFFHALDGASGSPGFLDVGVDGVSNPREVGRLPSVPPPPLDPDRDNFDAIANPTGTEGDGLFEEGEPLTDSGHRVVLHPKLAAPFRLGRFAELYPEVGWQETLYDSRQRGSEQRGLLTGRVDLRSRLRRHFEDDLVHVVEPFVGWAFVSNEHQSGDPLFVPETAVPQRRLRSLDLNNVTSDTADRIQKANELSFGITQRLFGDAREQRRRALHGDVTLLGLYDLDGGKMEDVLMDGRVTPWSLGDLRFHLGLLPRENRVIREGLAEWGWTHSAGHEVTLGYRYIRDIPLVFEDFRTGDRFDKVKPENRVNEATATLRIAVTRQWTASYRMAYSFESDVLIGNRGVIEYLSRCGCWSLGAELSEDRARGVEVKILYRIVGLGNDQEPNPGGLLDW